MKQGAKLGIVVSVGIAAMSSASILIRYAQVEGAPSLIIAAYRLTTATLVLTIPAIHERAWLDYAKLNKQEIGILLLSGLLLGLHFATWITSLAHTSVVSSVVLVNTTPLWIGLLAPLALSERTPRLTWSGIIIAIAGGSIIGLADVSVVEKPTAWGDLLALLGAIFGAGYYTIGRSVRSKIQLVAYLWVVYGTAAVLLVGWAVVNGLPLTGYTPRTVGWMVALGLVPQLIGHSAINYAVRHLSASLVGVVTLGEPIGTTLLATLLLQDIPKPLQLLGGALILIGIMFASLAEEYRKREVTISQST